MCKRNLYIHKRSSVRLIESSLPMATVAAGCSSSRARRAASRSSFIPGFYRALHSQSAAISFTATSRVNPGLNLPEVSGAADPELPQGCYLVERLIAARKNKVCSTEYCSNLKINTTSRPGFGACGHNNFILLMCAI